MESEFPFKYLLLGVMFLGEIVAGGIIFAVLSSRGKMPLAIGMLAMLGFGMLVTAYVVLKLM